MLIASDDKTLPTSPPPAHVAKEKDGRLDSYHSSDTENQDTSTSDPERQEKGSMAGSIRLPWWKRTAGYRRLKPLAPRRKRTRFASIGVVVLIVVVIIIAVLYETGHLGNKAYQYQNAITVRLTQGTYIGEITPPSDKLPRSIDAFRGIPYAQTTGGQNRFRPPQPLLLNNSDAVYPARDFGSVCPQGGRDQTEDCLSLNLYRPHFGDDAVQDAQDMAKLGGEGRAMPVVVYVHGGGFNNGAGRERNMASFVAFAGIPVIGINFNYRVGALGFPSSGFSARAGALNLGLKDQQMLFSWVQKNVANFGGDPTNVTIVGLSAGAHSIGHQVISYAPANKLTSDPAPFHRAIMESGAATARSVFAPTHPLYEDQFREFIAKCGLDKTPEEALMSQLQALPLDTVVAASRAVFSRYYGVLRWAFQPVVDGPGGIIPDLPIRSWEKGNVLRIPIITGFDTNEGAVFVPSRASNASALRDLMSPLIPGLNETDLKTMEDLYPDPDTPQGEKRYITKPPAGFGKQFWRLDDAYAHYAYICPVLQTAHFTSFTTTPVYVYQYAGRSGAHGGSDHGDEAPIVSHDMGVIAGMPGLVEAANAMTGAWARFAAFGTPNVATAGQDDTLVWTPFFSPVANSTGAMAGAASVERGQIAVFADGNDERVGLSGRQHEGIPAHMRNMTQREIDECKFWWDRVIFSEGFGNGSFAFAKRHLAGMAKL